VKHTAVKRIVIPLCVIFLGRCSLDPDKKLNDAVRQYRSNKPGALQALEYEFINNVSAQSVETPGLQTNGNALYALKGNNIEILDPVKLTLSMLDGGGVKRAYLSDDYCAIADETQLSIFRANGDHLIDNPIGDTKHPIRSIIISGDNVIYYKDQKLYTYNIVLKTSQQFIKDVFPPPYAPYYSVNLLKSGNLLGVNAGTAGSYNFSIINLANESVIVKNMSLSSSKIHMDGTRAYYITGNAGNWELIQYALDQMKKKSIARFSDIVDIELTSAGYVYESRDGLGASEYGKDKTIIPFTYRLSGRYRDTVLLKYRDIYYIADLKKMFAGLKRLKDQAPELFKMPNN